MKKLAVALAGMIFLVIHVLGFLAYFIVDDDAQTSKIYDGLGRELTVTPLFLRMFFQADRLWAGWIWTAADFVIYIGSLGLAYLLYSYSNSANLKDDI